MEAAHRKATVRTIAILCLASMLSSRTAAAQSDVPLFGNHPELATEVAAKLTARPAPDRSITVRVSFALRNSAELDQLLSDLQDPASPQYHKWLNPKQFDRRFARTPDEVEAVREWLLSKGFKVSQADAHKIISQGTVATAESAFAATIASSVDGSVYANASDPRIPAQFAGVIGSIEGLSNTGHSEPISIGPTHRRYPVAPASPQPTAFPPGRDRVRVAQSATQLASSAGDIPSGGMLPFAPADMYAFYDETPLANAGINGGGGDCIALPERSDYLDAAVNVFDTTFKLPAFTSAHVIADGVTPGFLTDTEDEALLDIEWARAAAPGAPISVYIGNDEASPSNDGLFDAISKSVTDDTCGTISVSFTYCGQPATFFTNLLDNTFKQAASQGQSVFVASGDIGAAIPVSGAEGGCVAGPSQGVNEMSADPNVISVGGTEITGSSSESAWNDASGSTGGGPSQYFRQPTRPKPAWQAGLGVPDDGARDVPDVSLAASANSPGYSVVVDRGGSTQLNVQGGTSFAAPIWAGLSKLIAQRAGVRLGNMNPGIYQLARAGQATNGFRDITVGDNGFNGVTGFSAGPGYDLATGWGSIDIEEFVSAIVQSYAWPMFHHDPAHTGLSGVDTSANSGMIEWKFPTGNSVVSSPSMGADGTIYVGSGGGDHHFYAIKPGGSTKWEFAVGDPVVSAPAIGADGTVYAACNDENL